MIAQIKLLPYAFEPSGWLFCDGRILPISENETLFNLLGNTFGGNVDENTFALPDLRAAAPRECRYCISLYGTYGENYYEGVVGETFLSAVSTNPQNLIECTGQSLSTRQHLLLQTYMGTRFGGDGANNFNLPDLRAKVPAKCRYLMAVQGHDPNSPRRDALFVGELMLLPFDMPLQHLRLCHGDRLLTQQNTALYSLLRNRFGGDAQQFALPDLRAAAPPKFNYYISLQGMLPPKS